MVDCVNPKLVVQHITVRSVYSRWVISECFPLSIENVFTSEICNLTVWKHTKRSYSQQHKLRPYVFLKVHARCHRRKVYLKVTIIGLVAYSQFATSFVKVMFLWTWSQRSWLTKSLVTEVLAQLRTQSSKVMFLRAWSQRSWLTKSLVTEVLAQLRTQSSKVTFLRA